MATQEAISGGASPHSDGRRRSQILSWLSNRQSQRAPAPLPQDDCPAESNGRALLPSAHNVEDNVPSSKASHPPSGRAETRPLSVLLFSKRRSIIVAPDSPFSDTSAEESAKFTVDLNPGQDGHVYHPGGLLRGSIGFVGCGEGASDVKNVSIRAVGDMRFTHYDMNESVMRRIVRTSRQRFMVMPLLKIDRTGIWRTDPDGENGHDRTAVPFELRLPEKGYAIFDPFRTSRNRAMLPPSMHWSYSNDPAPYEAGAVAEKSNGTGLNEFLDRLKRATKPARPDVMVQTRYFLEVNVRWRSSGPFYKTTSTQTDFIVLPRPPNSTSIKHAVPPRPTLDSPLAVALGATEAIALSSVRGVQRSGTTADSAGTSIGQSREDVPSTSPPGCAEQRRSRAPTIGYQGSRRLAINQTGSAHPPPAEPQWTKLVLMHSPRGPRAWQIHVLKATHEIQGWSLNAELLMPATVALVMDTVIPFRLFVSSNLKTSRVKTVNIKLLRSIASNTSYGKLILETMQEATLDGRPVLETRNVIHTAPPQSPPLDEYASNDVLVTETIEGSLFIASGWKQSRKEIDDNAHRTLSLKNAVKEDSTSVQRGALLTVPSFVFRCVTVEYSLGVEIVFQSDTLGTSCVTAQTETAPIKVASAAGASFGHNTNQRQPTRVGARPRTQRGHRVLSHVRSVSSLRLRASRQQGNTSQLRSRSRSRQASVSHTRQASAVSNFSAASLFQQDFVEPPLPNTPRTPHSLVEARSVADNSAQVHAGGQPPEDGSLEHAPLSGCVEEQREKMDIASDLPTPVPARPRRGIDRPGRGLTPSPTPDRPHEPRDASTSASGPPLLRQGRAGSRTVASPASMASLRTIDGPAPPYTRPYQDM